MNDAGPSGTSPAASTSERIARAVVRGLYDGSFVSGQRLVEPDLMALYGASRSAVREAIRRLEAEGVVDVLPHRGAQIRRLTEREARDALLVIEYCVGLAARLAAERIDEADNRATFTAALEQVLAHQNAAAGFEEVRARNRFYRVLARVAGSRDLQRFIPGVQVHLVRSRFPLPPEERFADYRKLGDAVLAGQQEAAEAAARSHIRKTAELMATGGAVATR